MRVRVRLAAASLALAVTVPLALAATLAAVGGCSHVTTVRVQEDVIEVGPGLRPLAAVQANATSAYLLFIPIPGVDLDQVINRMLVVTAKTIGADKIANLQFDVTPDGGVWALRKLIGWRSAQASGIAVQVTAPAADPDADKGPESPGDTGGQQAPAR
ncbi:MAG TPA: hypothetical protein VKB80_01980 [Kofleriaceae bacterium]|nr:hypothetical protein [Kofleriaceae bacterium]